MYFLGFFLVCNVSYKRLQEFSVGDGIDWDARARLTKSSFPSWPWIVSALDSDKDTVVLRCPANRYGTTKIQKKLKHKTKMFISAAIISVFSFLYVLR